MLVKLLKTTRPSALLSFFGIAVLFFALQLLHLSDYSFKQIGYPLFDLAQYLLFSNKWLAAILVFVLSLLMAMGFNNLISEKGVLKYNTVLPASVLIIFVSIFSFSPVWLAVFLMLFFLNKLLGVYQNERPYAVLFDAAFLLGMSVLIYPPTIFLFPIIYIANLTYSAVGWRNYVIPILGFISPLLMMACYLFFVDALTLYIEHYLRMLNLSLPSMGIVLSEGIFFVLLAILLLSAFKELAQWIALKSLRSRKAFIVFLAYFLFSLLGFFTLAADGLQHLLVLAFPIAALIANYLLFARKWWWYEVLFALFLLSAIYFHLSQVFGL